MAAVIARSFKAFGLGNLRLSKERGGRLLHHVPGQYLRDLGGLLRRRGFGVSMSGKGNRHDNAVMETSFKANRADLVRLCSWRPRRAAETAGFECISVFYKPRRKHSAPGWKSPLAFEKKAALMSTWTGTRP